MVPVMIRKLLLAGALLIAGCATATADCNGQLQAAYWCGNSNGSAAGPASGRPASSLLDAAFGNPSAQGTILNRGSSLWLPTSNPVLGKPGSNLGSLGFANSSGTGTVTLQPPSGNLGSSVLTLQAVTDTLAVLGTPQIFTAAITFTNNDLKLLGSSTGVTTFSSANSGASNFTITFPATSGTVALTSGANVASVSNSDGTLTISPTTGNVVSSINLSHANTWTNTLTLAPPTGTLTQGLLVNLQTGPTSCPSSCTSSVNYNEIDVSNPGYGVTGSSTDSFGLNPAIAALRINFSAGGANVGGAAAVIGASRDTGSIQNLVGGMFTSYSNITDTSAPLWGAIGGCLLGAAASVNICISVDAETAIASGAVLNYHYGSRADSASSVQGSVEDAAFVVEHDNSPPGYGGTSKPWKDALLLTSALSTLTPLDAAGNVIHATATFTTGCLICMPNVTFSNFIVDVPNLVITGAGVGIVTGPSGGNIWVAKTASGGNASLAASTNGASGFDGLQVADSSNDNQLIAVLFEASFNALTRFGVSSPGNYVIVSANGSTNAGLMVGTIGNHPLILGTNNNAVETITGAGATTFSGTLTVSGMASLATTSAVCYNTVSGLLTYDGTIGTCNTSDERLKTFDHPFLFDALDALIAIANSDKFGYFHARGTEGRAQFGADEHIGIGAQTVAKYFPQLTATGTDGMMSLAYDKLTVPIIDALAELKADNDNLRKEVERLKRRRVQ